MARLSHIRKCNTLSALVFIHGFTGDLDTTWANFPRHLILEPSLDDWNILTLGYPTSILPGTHGVWSADPDLPLLATSLFTELNISPLTEFTDIAIAAHSMGGLMVQRSLADNPVLSKKVRHVFLMGTPSAGIEKANLIRRLLGIFANDQIKNMATNSDFISDLRRDWNQAIGDDPPFQFFTIAGSKDNFVLAKSSLGPFAKRFRRVVEGDHLSMVKPKEPSADIVRLLVSALTKQAEPAGPSLPLRIAAELGAAAPEGLAIAHAAAVGDQVLSSQAEVVEAALALDIAGKRPEAIQLLERHQHFGTDVKGTLAGRIKRRWIQENHEGDAHWALGLYASALETASTVTPETQNSIGQVYYHAINVAYLKQVAFGDSKAARGMAELALQYAQKAEPADVWSVATEAEANLYLGNQELALAKYQQVVAMSPEKWKLISTGQQAQQVAAKMGHTALEEQLRNLFDPPASQRAAKV